jgi:hypothetical protein
MLSCRCSDWRIATVTCILDEPRSTATTHSITDYISAGRSIVCRRHPLCSSDQLTTALQSYGVLLFTWSLDLIAICCWHRWRAFVSPQLMKFDGLLDFVRQCERGGTFRGYKYSSSLLWKVFDPYSALSPTRYEGYQAILVEVRVVAFVGCDYLSRLYSNFATVRGTRNFFVELAGQSFPVD